MAPHSPRPSPNRGFTRTDLGVVLAVVGLLAVLATSVLGKISPAAHRAGCANNLRQLGVGILKYASENNNLPPWYVLTNKGGTAGSQLVFQHLAKLSNYVDSPEVMVCPADAVKKPALDFSTYSNGFLGMGNQAAGYNLMTELSLDTPRSKLLGDRLMGGGLDGNTCTGTGYVVSGLPLVPVRRFTSSSNPHWLPESHNSGIGHLLFSDGSVQTLNTAGLQRSILGKNPVDDNGSNCTMIP